MPIKIIPEVRDAIFNEGELSLIDHYADGALKDKHTAIEGEPFRSFGDLDLYKHNPLLYCLWKGRSIVAQGNLPHVLKYIHTYLQEEQT